MALFDVAHLDEDFADPFRARAALALNLARGHHVMLSHQTTAYKNVAYAQPAAVAAGEIFEARSAHPIHLQQHVAQRLFALQVFMNLAGLRELIYCDKSFAYE